MTHGLAQVINQEKDLRIVGDAGHSAFEPGITHELISATDRFAQS